MYALTADQVGSRTQNELGTAALKLLGERYGDRLLLPPDRTAGDEIQFLTDDAAAALGLVLDLSRMRHWSIGLGIGSVRSPLPDATREATGAAFYAARDAVTRAKKRATRFATTSAANDDDDSSAATDLEPLIDLLLVLRARRSAAGWELADLLADGRSQREAARHLGISAPAASSRANAANIRVEQASIPALTKLMVDLDNRISGTDPDA